ncbi:MAG: LPS export ABC transporter periplasmic protein LptC [Alphaproteobacteria bacterium]|nr:LPS export ABC transporter periplasmic protein LptC [Alphaproteobacteria bacterium]
MTWQPRRWSVASLRRQAASHTRLVGLLKISLPLAAVAIVVVLIMWPYVTDRVASGFRLTFADVDETADGTVTMINARYLGTDQRGQPFTITADAAAQNPAEPDRITLTRLAGDIALSDGPWIILSSDQGVYSQEARVLELSGAVSLYADSGYELRTERARLDLAAEVADGDAPVEGQGPLGHLQASGFRVTEGGQRLLFLGPVRLTLYPAAEG